MSHDFVDQMLTQTEYEDLLARARRAAVGYGLDGRAAFVAADVATWVIS